MPDRMRSIRPGSVRRRPRWRSEHGANIVEMAIVGPLLVLMALGVGDFGRIMYTGVVLGHAARAGAQYGSQNNGKAQDRAGAENAARQEAQNLGTIGATAQLICECQAGTPVDCTTTTCAGGYGVPRVFSQVTTTFTFRTLVDYPGIPDTVPLTRVAKVRVQ